MGNQFPRPDTRLSDTTGIARLLNVKKWFRGSSLFFERLYPSGIIDP
jgi:hypothetical protein